MKVRIHKPRHRPTPHHYRKKFLAFLLALTMLFSLMGTAFATESYPKTSQEAYDLLMEIKKEEKFQEGSLWTDEYPYGDGEGEKYPAISMHYIAKAPVRIGNKIYSHSRGCAAFGYELQDRLFAGLPARTYVKGKFTYDNIHVGDHLRIYNDTHSVVVLQVTPAACVVVEGNHSGRVRWGRVISKDVIMAADYLVTRWPVGLPNDSGIKDVVDEANKGNIADTEISWEMTNSGVLRIKGTGAIPNFSLSNPAPWADLAYNTVIISDGITAIGDYAFYGEREGSEGSFTYKSSLIEVIMPTSIKTIGTSAFENCVNLVSASIPNGVQQINNSAFRACTSLSSVDLPGSITKLGDGVFADCIKLYMVVFANSEPGTKITVGKQLFLDCVWLGIVVLPSNLETIGADMFTSCGNLAGLMIPKSVKKIELNAFSACRNIEVITYEGTRADWEAAAEGSLALLGLTNMGQPCNPGTNAKTLLDNAIKNGEILLEIPYVNPFEYSNDNLQAETVEPDPEHQHTWAETWAFDNAHHWHECEDTTNCTFTEDTANSEKDGYGLHEYEEGSTTCKACEAEHEHLLATVWESSEASHWHKCTLANCPAQDTLEAAATAHTYDNNAICTVCKYAHQHRWSTGSEPANYEKDDSTHWRFCTDESCPVRNSAAHRGKYDITYHKYDHDNGTKCVCGAEKPADPHVHDWSDWKGNDAQHWRECTNPDCPEKSEGKGLIAKTDVGYHVYPTVDIDESDTDDPFADEQQDIPATLTDEDGIDDDEDPTPPAPPQTSNNPDTQEPVTCTICGREQPENYVDPGHTWSDDWADNTSDPDHHWRVCTNTDAEHEEGACTAKTDYAVHTYDQDDNTMCACGAEKPAEPHVHDWSDEWSTDAAEGGNHHWKACKDPTCGAMNHYGTHSYDADTGKCECDAEKPAVVTPPCNHVDTNEDGICDNCGEDMPGQDPGPVTDEHLANFASHSKTDFDSTGACTKKADCPYTLAQFQEDCTVDHSTIAKTSTCEACGATGTKPDGNEPNVPDAPDNPITPGTHQHSWSSVWSYNGAYHWHNCTTSDCTISEVSQKSGYTTHTYGYWVTDVYASAYRDGSEHRDCTVCGYRQTATIPATGYYPSYRPGNTGNSSSNNNSGNSNNSSSSSTTTDPTKPVTTTSTDPNTGVQTTTTTYPDGSSEVSTIQLNGTITTVNTDANGQTKTQVNLSASAVSAAVERNEPINLPIADIPVFVSASMAPPITINTGSINPVKVAIPTTSPTVNTVAVIVHPDGSAEVIKSSVAVGNSIVAPVPNGSTIKIVDNSKSFADVSPNVWSAEAIAFVSSRELFAGTSATDFSPNEPMTRAMLMTVLARFDGANTEGGSTWYAKSMEWAIAHGVSDGSNPNGNITREQLVTMLWRYYGSPAMNGTLSNFTDSSQISNWAQSAMAWATANGVINGFEDSSLQPQGQATRAQVAQILQNLLSNTQLSPKTLISSFEHQAHQ